jgi:hypothetical protein
LSVAAVAVCWAPNSMDSAECWDSRTVVFESNRMQSLAFREYTVVAGMWDSMDVHNSVPQMHLVDRFASVDVKHEPVAAVEAVVVNYDTYSDWTLYYSDVLHYAVLIDVASSHLVVVAVVVVDLIELYSVVIVASVVYQPVADTYVVGIIDIEHRRPLFA